MIFGCSTKVEGCRYLPIILYVHTPYTEGVYGQVCRNTSYTDRGEYFLHANVLTSGVANVLTWLVSVGTVESILDRYRSTVHALLAIGLSKKGRLSQTASRHWNSDFSHRFQKPWSWCYCQCCPLQSSASGNSIATKRLWLPRYVLELPGM